MMNYLSFLLQFIVFTCIKYCSTTRLLFHFNLSNSSISWDNIRNLEIASSCTDLDLSLNNLAGLIPNGAFNLFKLLERLDLKNNQLTHLQHHSFYYHVAINSSYSTYENGLQWKPLKLHSLDLSYNEFQVLTTNWLNEITSTLRYLDLSHNKIISISEKFIFGPDLNSLRLKMFNNPVKCMTVRWMRNLSNRQINVTCFDYKSLLRNTVVNVPISSNNSAIQIDSHKYFHELSVKSIPIQELEESDDYYFQTDSSYEKYDLTCVYRGDNIPVIVWFHGERLVEKSIESMFLSKQKVENKQIISTLTGQTRTFDINLTCIFLKAKTTLELNKISFNIRKRQVNQVNQATHMLIFDEYDKQATSNFFNRHASIFYVVLIVLLFGMSVFLCTSFVVAYYILIKYKNFLFLTEI